MFQKIIQKFQTREGLMFAGSFALIVVGIAIILGGFSHQSKGPMGDSFPSTITVSGSGEVVTIPDIAQFSFTVSHDAKTMNDAQKAVTEQANTLIEKLKSAGIEEKDIATQGFNAYPKYENRPIAASSCISGYCPGYPSNSVVVGYTVSHTYLVKVRNLDHSGDIAKIITDANVSSLNGPDFTIDDSTSLKNNARSEAIVDAKTQARILARQLGVRLGKIVDFQVVSDGSYPPMMAYARNMSADSFMEKAPSPEILPGETKIKVQVSITYKIR